MNFNCQLQIAGVLLNFSSTSFQASLIKEFEGTGGDETCSVETGLFYHFVGGAESVESILTRLLKNFKIDFHLDDMEVPLSSKLV